MSDSQTYNKIEDLESSGGEDRWGVNGITVGFVVTEANVDTMAGDYFTAMELGEELSKQLGWKIVYLERSKNDYDTSGLDVLIVMLDKYDVSQIQQAKPNLLKIAWARNWFKRWVNWEWFQDYDLVWCSSEKAANFVSYKIPAIPVSVLRIGTNYERFSQGIFKPELKSDYCFVGSYWYNRREIIDCLDPREIPFNFALYGANWKKFPQFQNAYRGQVKYTEIPHIYASTKIAIDDANSVTKSWGSANSRIFDAIASGALVISNGQLGNEDAFDGELPIYSSSEDLRKLLEQYLTNEQQRLAKVERLKTIVREKHTYEYRAKSASQSIRSYVSFQ